jgi:hypothetical protein
VRFKDSREVFLLQPGFTTLMTRSLEELFDTTFLYTEIFENLEQAVQYIEHVKLERDGEVIELRRRTEDDFVDAEVGTILSNFQLLQPIVAEGDDWMIQNLILEDVVRIRPETVEAIRPDDLSIYGLDDPFRLTVTLLGEASTLLIGNRNAEHGGRYVMIEGSDAVLIDMRADYAFVNATVSQLRSVLIWLHYIDDVSSVVFDLDGERRVLRFEHNEDDNSLRGWFDDVEISSVNARRMFVSVLMITQGGETNEPIPAGVSPVYTITINFLDGSSDSLELYQLSETQFLIVHAGVNTGFTITRLSLHGNLLRRIEILDAGGDIPAT